MPEPLEFLPPECNAPHACYCGCGAFTPHLIGEHGCLRKMVATPAEFGRDPERHTDLWLVDGQLITEYTMREQRGYHRHECGCWSRTAGSDNSIPDNT